MKQFSVIICTFLLLSSVNCYANESRNKVISTINSNYYTENMAQTVEKIQNIDKTMGDDDYFEAVFNCLDDYSMYYDSVQLENLTVSKIEEMITYDRKEHLNVKIVYFGNGIEKVFSEQVDIAKNAAREDVTKAKDGDELVIEFNRATDRPDNMLANLALENAEDKFGEGATAVWNSDKKLVITLGTGSVISTSSKIIVKNVKFANGTGKLSQSNASESEAIAITGKFDGREYWIDSATKAVANGRTRITVSLTKSAIATEATNVFAICQAYNSKNTVETISAIGVPDKATNSFIFDFNATNLTDFEVVVLKGDYSDMNAGVDVYSDTIKPTTAE